MPSLKESQHFVLSAGIPRISGSTTFREVYQVLERDRKGAFLLLQKDLPVSYVKAYPLAEKVITDAKGDVEKLRFRSGQSIQEVVAELSAQLPAVPVSAQPVDVTADESDLQQRGDTAFTVEEVGQPVGWYLNHETVYEAQTERTIFICRRNHRNTDPDSGTCWKCPAPIVRTEKEKVP
jgi:hypothetical protein